MTGPQWPGPVWPGPGPQPPSWPGPPPAPKPERGPRPDDVKLSVQLWIFVIVCSTIARIAEALSVRGSRELREAYAEIRKTDGDRPPVFQTFESFENTLFTMAIVVTVLVAIGVCVLVYLNWLGQAWTRIALQLVAGFVVMFGILSFGTDDPLVAVPSILAAVAVVGAVIAGNSRESLEYFKPGATS
ncbi:putative protein OS=Tsukamurella paurometabola (strain ATCC 8368 / DSM / CCUG 35730 /CIP 100753 / JCM 10117 / KCTC 9821 / NBRC 16120 / NCIMB 702349/ NCTC 13040) OX=521096 GN=Tpau_0671 PE=4 SV=1 [Tsukamurella paurometabola]|uniref:Uncharacterized protein n=1 Tax=Tsukamurella paurometabola (strain ATCC 8368 / DSM 20162 / CCUG 35730 / CIP 100753 / JCM 10117 / KCTC 9821 / NBRC 16120 / NCIMB 702349 / NCTC 13040) TaxID=521096 RepID=D5UT21_TSUPD|nr:hypothetical protein [Tsukamurella paurometabola]ADG77308.1 conserved hypothetical protein [Tsukamurella paurometabola DSM 20162]SUP43450.1 Uncharacterised protein [Tsukamurella paurometabola]